MLRAIFFLIAIVLAGALRAQGPAERWLADEVPPEIRRYVVNTDGSCVQCSCALAGIQSNNPNAATLLWDTEYGPAERGGSGPDRVASYARRRGLALYNVTGPQTYDWMRWSVRNGRWCAIGAGGNHFQTLTDYDPQRGVWSVCNNNSTGKIDEYSESGFRRLHEASGEWCVVLDCAAAAPPPRYVRWWK